MKVKSLLSLILVAALAALGCNKVTLKPVIKAIALDIPRASGEYALPYSIENPSDGASLTATCEADWIYDIKVEEGKVVFNAELNADKSRSADMKLSYPGAADLVVKINQASVFEGVFNIKVKDITPYGATVVYTPVEYDGGYIFFVMAKSAVQDYLLDEEGLEELYRGDLEYVQEIADYNNVTLEECLKRAPQFYTADGSETVMKYSDLDVNTDYVAYCYGLSLDGKKLTETVVAEFRTEIVETSDIKFEASVTDITKNSASITVTPSNEDYYFWTYISEMDYAKYSLDEIMSNMLANIKTNVESWGVAITDYIHSGPSHETPTDLWAGTKYYIVAWGMDYGGSATTKPVEVTSFTTESEAVTDDCQFKLTITQVKPMDIRMKIEPTKADTRYYAAFIEESKCVGYNDRQMAQRIVNMENKRFEDGGYYDPEDNNWTAQTHVGTNEFWGNADLYWTFLPEHTYQMYVFGVDANGNITTEVARIDQKTEPAVKSDMTVKAELVKSTWNYGTFQFTPSNNTEYYLPFLLETQYADLYKKADGTYDEAMLMEDIEHYYENEILYKIQKGPSEQMFYWTSDTDYTMLVFGYAGMNTTPFFETEHHSPAIPFGKSDAEVEATYEFIDGTALCNKFPERWDHAEYDGSCIMVMRFTPNEHCLHWYGGVWAPISTYEMGIDHLMALIRNDSAPANAIDVYQQTCRPWYNYPWSFSYVAEGTGGNFGQWHYIEFTPTVDQCVEPYDFWSNPYDGTTKVFSMSKTSREAPADITEKVLRPADGKLLKAFALGHKTESRQTRDLE